MCKISTIFLLLLLLDGISSIQTWFNEDEKEAIPIEIGSSVEYDKIRSYFQFNYEGSTPAKIFFNLDDEDLFLTYPDGTTKVNLKNDDDKYSDTNYIGNLTQNGIYHLTIICRSFRCEIGGSFSSLLFGSAMKIIDFSESSYFNDQEFHLSGNQLYGLIEYNVSGLRENKSVYFTNLGLGKHYLTYYYPYYPDYPDAFPYELGKDFELAYHPNLTAFEVYNIGTNTSEKCVSFYEFKERNEYIIKIHSLIYYSDYMNDD